MKNKHPYYKLLHVLRRLRNKQIEDFRHFKRDRVNRQWMDHRFFSLTVRKFREEIKKTDQVIAGAKRASSMSKITGVNHMYDFKTDSVVPM